jgi:hypothetical protein
MLRPPEPAPGLDDFVPVKNRYTWRRGGRQAMRWVVVSAPCSRN